jgi:hypothetical protein
VLDRNIWFYCQQTGERVALLVGELAAETVRAEDGLTLRLRHFTQVAEGPCYETATILRKSAPLAQRTLDLLPLLWSEVLDLLVALKDTLSLLWGQLVQLIETVEHALLRLLWKIAEARLILKCVLLLLGRKVAVVIHPLGKMFLILLWSRLMRGSHRLTRRLARSMHGGRLNRNHRAGRQEKQRGSESWLEDSPQMD